LGHILHRSFTDAGTAVADIFRSESSSTFARVLALFLVRDVVGLDNLRGCHRLGSPVWTGDFAFGWP